MKRRVKHALLAMLALVLLVTLTAYSTESGGTSDKPGGKAEVELLNASYDPTRELYDEYNEAFADYWSNNTGQKVTIRQSHGGSGKQSRAVMDGLKADVVTLALGYDIDALAKKELVAKDWQKRFKLNSAPYTSTIVLLVRKGNPKDIHDWSDLIKDGVEVITPNPQTSGGARWNYLAAWGYGLHHNGNDSEKAKAFVKKLYQNVPVLDTGARGATTTFVNRGIGDVLITWENEAMMSVRKLGPDKFEMIYPSESILAEPPVAVVDRVVDRRGTREVAAAYLDYLYSEEGQTIAAKNFYRPTLQSVKDKYKEQFPDIKLYRIEDEFGGWAKVQAEHFGDGGVFDQIYTPGQ